MIINVDDPTKRQEKKVRDVIHESTDMLRSRWLGDSVIVIVAEFF